MRTLNDGRPTWYELRLSSWRLWNLDDQHSKHRQKNIFRSIKKKKSMGAINRYWIKDIFLTVCYFWRQSYLERHPLSPEDRRSPGQVKVWSRMPLSTSSIVGRNNWNTLLLPLRLSRRRTCHEPPVDISHHWQFVWNSGERTALSVWSREEDCPRSNWDRCWDYPTRRIAPFRHEANIRNICIWERIVPSFQRQTYKNHTVDCQSLINGTHLTECDQLRRTNCPASQSFPCTNRHLSIAQVFLWYRLISPV